LGDVFCSQIIKARVLLLDWFKMRKNLVVKGTLVGVLLAFLAVGVPYLFLRDIESFYGSYLYWIVLTFLTMVVIWWRVSKWGEES